MSGGGVKSGKDYRPDIEGLRTIAVLPVLLFHAGIPGFGGGYVGVDIFFVISGYLITGILLRDLDLGTYSIARFYERRIRRIFPALSVVVLACLIVGWGVLAPNDYADLGKSAIAVAAFVSNFYYWKSVNYFDNAQAIQPLLHTWSLAVEEQFYILFPPLLAWLARRKVPLRPSLMAMAVVSFALAATIVFFKPSAAFYLPVTRAWELLAGSLLAGKAIFPNATHRQREVAAAVGAACALVPVMAYDSTTVFPGLAALPPVLGASLIIWSGQGGATSVVGRILSTAPMTFVGRISYSLYLWHVPVFAFIIYLTAGTLSLPMGIAAIVISMILAWVSYLWVETPFRQNKPIFRLGPVAVGSLAMIVVGALAIGITLSHGLPSRLGARGAALVAAAGDKERFHVECMSNGDVIVDPKRACRLGANDTQPTALLWGDSHAMVVATPMEEAAKSQKAAFLFAASADCPIGIGFSIDTGTEKALTETPSYRYCATYNDAMLHLARDTPSITHVVLASRWTNWRLGEPANPAEAAADIRLRDETGVARSTTENAAIFERGFRRLVIALRAAGKQVTIVGPLPEPQFNVPQRLYVQQFGFAGIAEPISVRDYKRRHARILSMFARMKGLDGVSFVWPSTALCRRDVCPIEEEGHAIFFDHDHLSLWAARRTTYLYRGIFS